MKTLIAFLILASVCWAGDSTVELAEDGETSSSLTFNIQSNNHYMSIDTETGQVYIDGKSIEKLSDPEVREAMKSIAKVMIERSTGRYLNQQTSYLLDQLDRCHDLNDRMLKVLKKTRTVLGDIQKRLEKK